MRVAYSTAKSFLVIVAFLFGASLAWSQANNECDQPGEAPDVVPGPLLVPIRHGTARGISAYSFGTNACNLGTCWMKFIASTNEHPLISQNMYRLKNGRFEQIGQSWLKHAFGASQLAVCATGCIASPSSDHLGVNCSDPYSSGLNGTQTNMGPKFEVNGYTGEFPYPPYHYYETGDVIFKRLQVHNVDLDPALNAGAAYFAEVQYIARDDAMNGNGGNNASYRPVSVSGSGTTFNVAFAGSMVRGVPAIRAWKAADPSVVETQVMAPGDGRFNVGATATDLGDGYWHYEYAVHNLDAQRAAGSISVPLPVGATVRNVGFHDVDYHSSELVDPEDWPGVVESAPPAVSWHTHPFLVNAYGNAVRWGTLYNFRFDANVPPSTGDLTLGLWRTGTPAALNVTTVVPQVCDNDGVCDPGEACLRCPADCGAPDAAGQCCGNGVCQSAGESPCSCPQDCGSPSPSEVACENQQDDDCDGVADCADSDCCGDGQCLAFFDSDGDAHPATCDCDETNAQVWATPGESSNLTFSRGGAGESSFAWGAPGILGGTLVSYDTLRTSDPSDFVAAATCLAAGDPFQPANSDAEDPALEQAFYYLVRARNDCPSGLGSSGSDSSGQPRAARACP